MNKIRKQVYLNVEQEQRLTELAAKAGVSEAEIIRLALDAYLLSLEKLPAEHPLSFLAGIGSTESAAKLGGRGSDQDQVIYQL